VLGACLEGLRTRFLGLQLHRAQPRGVGLCGAFRMRALAL
jgi:hypothetical protein